MRIELVTTGLDVGGAEVQVRDLALGMKARGHDVGVVSLLAPKAFAKQLAAADVAVVSLEIARERKDVVEVIAAARRFRQHIAARSPDIVHAHMVHANLFARLALAFSDNRLICTVHNTHEGGRGRDLAYALTNWAARLNTTISEAATRRFVSAHVLPHNTLTIYNGIDTARFKSLRPPLQSSGPFRWIAIGRLERQKDYPTLLRALAMVPDASLAIAGQGERRTELETLTAQLGVADRVEFLGVRRDIPELLSRYDGFVLSSAWEGFGIALVEAMAAGLPVVATRSGGPQEIIGDNGDVGLLVPTADPEALAAAMIGVASQSASDRRLMGENARRRSLSAFDINVALDRWQAIYEAVRFDLPISDL